MEPPPHLSACLSVPLPLPLILSDHQINLLIGVCLNVKHSSTLFCFDHFFLLEHKRRKSYEEVRQISWKEASMTIAHTFYANRQGGEETKCWLCLKSKACQNGWRSWRASSSRATLTRPTWHPSSKNFRSTD